MATKSYLETKINYFDLSHGNNFGQLNKNFTSQLLQNIGSDKVYNPQILDL